MHWNLFIFFNHENGRNGIIDLFFQDRFVYLSTQIVLGLMYCLLITFCSSFSLGRVIKNTTVTDVISS
jgi:hypothetical protein